MTATAGYEDLFRTQYALLVRALTLCTGNPDDAADAAQDAFMQLHRHWTKVARYDDASGWLYRVAVNRALNQRRGRVRQRRTADRVAANTIDTHDSVRPDDELWNAVRDLPPQQRAVVGLYYLADLDVSAVAAAMGVTPGTVKTHLHEARRRLRSTLEVRDDA